MARQFRVIENCRVPFDFETIVGSELLQRFEIFATATPKFCFVWADDFHFPHAPQFARNLSHRAQQKLEPFFRMNASDKQNCFLARHIRCAGKITKRERIWQNTNLRAQLRRLRNDRVTDRARNSLKPCRLAIPTHLALRSARDMHVNQPAIARSDEKRKPESISHNDVCFRQSTSRAQ